jgi:hypothetical protein
MTSNKHKANDPTPKNTWPLFLRLTFRLADFSSFKTKNFAIKTRQKKKPTEI